MISLAAAGVGVAGMAVTYPVANRQLARLQANVEREYPDATFVIFKSAQVSP